MDRLISRRATLVINPLINASIISSMYFYSKKGDIYQEMSNLKKGSDGVIEGPTPVNRKRRMAKTKTWTLWKDGKLNEEEANILRRRATEVPVPFDEAARKDIKTVTDSFLSRDDALGLAAPQIGISKRIVIFKNKNFQEKTRTKNREDYDILINPRVTQIRGEEEKMTEGCLSCPDVSVEVTRATEIKVRALDEQGGKVNKRYTGFLARIVQHELDHLEGKLVIDHAGTIYFPKEKEAFFTHLFHDETTT
jgi:peptide deformylase